MRNTMFGAMMAGLLGLAGAGSTTAQVVGPDGWWSSEYLEGYTYEDGRLVERGARGARSDRYDDGRFDRGRRGRGAFEGRGRVEVRGDGRVGYRQPGRVVMNVRPSHRARMGYDSGYLWTEVYWDVRFRRNARFADRGRKPPLRRLVGRQTVDRLRRHGNRIGVRGALRYRWIDYGRRVTVLQVRAGRTPIAEFVDFGNDQRVDVVRLSRSAW